MNKNLKFIIIAVLVIVLGLFIKSRIISRENFDLLVLMETNDVLENCNQRIKANQISKLTNIAYDNKMHNNYISKYGENICTDTNKVKIIIEKYYRESLKEQWKFVF